MVGVVPVTVPVGGIDVDLGVTGPFSTADNQPGIKEIRTGITVVNPGLITSMGPASLSHRLAPS